MCVCVDRSVLRPRTQCNGPCQEQEEEEGFPISFAEIQSAFRCLPRGFFFFFWFDPPLPSFLFATPGRFCLLFCVLGGGGGLGGVGVGVVGEGRPTTPPPLLLLLLLLLLAHLASSLPSPPLLLAYMYRCSFYTLSFPPTPPLPRPFFPHFHLCCPEFWVGRSISHLSHRLQTDGGNGKKMKMFNTMYIRTLAASPKLLWAAFLLSHLSPHII